MADLYNEIMLGNVGVEEGRRKAFSYIADFKKTIWVLPEPPTLTETHSTP